VKKIEQTTVLSEEVFISEASWMDDEPYVTAEEIEKILGWELKPEGLCKKETCVPVGEKVRFSDDGLLNLEDVAGLVGQPILSVSEIGMVAVGQPHELRSAALKNRVAPDFVLPDISEVDRALSDWSGKKRLLVAFSSW